MARTDYGLIETSNNLGLISNDMIAESSVNLDKLSRSLATTEKPWGNKKAGHNYIVNHPCIHSSKSVYHLHITVPNYRNPHAYMHSSLCSLHTQT